MKKVDQAKAIYAANAGKSRKEVIALIQEVLQATEVSASSYYSTAKKAAQLAAEADRPKGKSAIVKEVAEKLGVPVVDIPVSKVDPKDLAGVPETKPEYAPSRTRVADPNAKPKDALSRYYTSLPPEEQATWAADIKRYQEEYTKDPITFGHRA